MNTVKTQQIKDGFWHDENGSPVQVKRLTKSEKLQERKSALLLKGALKLNESLVNFKELANTICREVFEDFMTSKNVKDDYKGNYTWYNFDHSIKVEVSISERIAFDELTITACKAKLDEFLDSTLTTEKDIIQTIVKQAFETSKGQLNTRNVMSLLRHKSKVKNPLFQEAMELLQESIRKPSSKSYFRIYTRNEEGKYENIQLNFSSID